MTVLLQQSVLSTWDTGLNVELVLANAGDCALSELVVDVPMGAYTELAAITGATAEQRDGFVQVRVTAPLAPRTRASRFVATLALAEAAQQTLLYLRRPHFYCEATYCT